MAEVEATMSNSEVFPLVHSHDTALTDTVTPSIRYSYGSPSLGRKNTPIQIKRRRQHHNGISTRLRWMTNGSALLCVFLFSGIIFGWAPLKLILLREGQFASLCNNPNTHSDDIVADANADATPCVAQMERLNRIFTSAQFFLSFASLPVGFFLDHASKATHYTMAAVLEITGLLFMAWSDYSSPNLSPDDIPLIDHFLVGYTCMALGGGMVMLGAFPASFLLPTVQGGLLASVSCLFDASSIVFAIFKQLHDTDPTLFSRQNLFLVHATVAIVVFGILVVCWVLLERQNWKLELDDDDRDNHNSNNNNNNADIKYGSIPSTEEQHNGNGNGTITAIDIDMKDAHARRIERLGMHDWPLLQQLTTLDFVVVLVFASVHMLRCNFYIETVNEILLDVSGGGEHEDEAIQYAQIFSFVLPLGIVFVPLIDQTVRSYGIIRTLHLTNTIGVVFGTLLLVPNPVIQGINFMIFTAFRAYLYATLNTYVAVTFGVSTMGRVIGCSFTTAAIVTLWQYPAANLAEDVYGGNFFITNLLFLALGAIVPVALALYYSHVVVAQTGFGNKH